MTFQEVERARKEYKTKALKRCGVVFAVVFLFFALFFMRLVVATSTEYEIMPRDVVLAIAILCVAWVVIALIVSVFLLKYWGLKRSYVAAYKAYFVEQALAQTFAGLVYSHESGMARDVPGETGMIRLGDIFNSNDLTTGTYNDVNFTQADIHIQERRETDDGEYYVTIFKGRWMVFEFPKKFRSRLEVVERGFKGSKIANADGRKFEMIKVESNEFNNIFKAYTEDSVEGYSLLDPAMIERILMMREKCNGKLLLGFVNNKLHIGLDDRKDAFEPPRNFFRPLDEATEKTKVAGEIQIITGFIDGLRLDRKIFQ